MEETIGVSDPDARLVDIALGSVGGQLVVPDLLSDQAGLSIKPFCPKFTLM